MVAFHSFLFLFIYFLSFYWYILKMVTSFKIQIYETSYRFSLADANVDEGWDQGADRGLDRSISLTKFPTPLFGAALFFWIL
jgi:hypothetical protein